MNLWDITAGWYDGIRRLWPWRQIWQQENEAAQSLLSTLPQQSGWALDIGCGIGHSWPLLPKEAALIGMDSSVAMAKQCRSRHSGHVVVGDMQHLPFKQQVFVRIHAVGVTEYCKNTGPLWKEWGGLLQPKATLFVTLSPAGWLSRLRRIAGHRLWIHPAQQILDEMRQAGLVLTGVQHIPSQHQLLLMKL
jgi:SAM-dependent methyltransferase